MVKNNRLFSLLLSSVFLFTIFANKALAVIELDPALPVYTRTIGVGGNLNSVGSDTLNNLMTLWSEEFRKLYPGVNIQIEGKGSATAPTALIGGSSQLGPMSRKMKTEEIELFKEKYGFVPVAIGVALDALSVFVNKNNPVDTISFLQIDGVFSNTHKSGFKNITDWQDLINDSKWQKKSIRMYGRNSASGTYGYFKKHALFGGDFKSSVKERPGSSSVVQSVSGDLYGIGYSGLGYLTSNVKALKLSRSNSSPAFDASYENVLSGKYPLSRLLYIYIVKDPKKKLAPIITEFFKFVLSKKGQEVVIKDGYLPLNSDLIKAQLKKIN